MARKFLYVVVAVTMLVVAAAFLYRAYEPEIMALAMVPPDAFDEAGLPPAPDYTAAEAWLSRPGAEGGAAFQPPGDRAARGDDVPVFFIHPTTFLKRTAWNAPLDDADAQDMLRTRILPGQASAFSAAGPIYAPQYRQAAFGAFLDRTGSGLRAIIAAYGDVLRAFDQFIVEIGDKPFIIAGHSQGALHGLNLLRDRIAATPLRDRLVAAYLIGWPISVEADLAAVGIPACGGERDTGCAVSWQSFAGDGDPAQIERAFNVIPGLTGMPRVGTTILCVNPLSWEQGGTAVAAADNPGALIPPGRGENGGELVEDEVGAGCREDGFLYLDGTPGEAFGGFVMPGGNYHVYDIHLFYESLWRNVRSRTAAYREAGG